MRQNKNNEKNRPNAAVVSGNVTDISTYYYNIIYLFVIRARLIFIRRSGDIGGGETMMGSNETIFFMLTMYYI